MRCCGRVLKPVESMRSNSLLVPLLLFVAVATLLVVTNDGFVVATLYRVRSLLGLGHPIVRVEWTERDSAVRGAIEAAAGTASSSVRIAVATMAHSPLNLGEWLEHHSRLGVFRFYLRLEHVRPPAVLARRPWKLVVDVEIAPPLDAHLRHYEVQQERQLAFVRKVIPRARAANATHLLHIDDDELLVCPHGPALLRGALHLAGAREPSVVLQTLEALYPADTATSFAHVRAFQHSKERFSSYASGKSLGVLALPGLVPTSVHRFAGGGGPGARAGRRGARWAAAAASGDNRGWFMPPPVAVVLHFESPSLSAWLRKFEEMARSGSRGPPFPFYSASLAAARALNDARNATPGSRRAAAAVRTARERAVALWQRWKRQPPGLPLERLDERGGAPLVLEALDVTLLRPLDVGYGQRTYL